MVKTVKTENSNPQSSTQPSENIISSNPEDNITIKVKTNIDATIHDIKINKNATVLVLKGEIEKVIHIPTQQQKLVYKDQTMNNSFKISTYGLANDSIIAMETIDPPQTRGLGGLENISNLGGLNEINPQQIGQLMNEPQFQQDLNAVMNNPEILNYILNSTETGQLVQQNPQLREILENPRMRQLLLGPQMFRRIMQQGEQGGPNTIPEGVGGGLGNLGNVRNMGVSQDPNPKLGELFSQWMKQEKLDRPSLGGTQTHPQPSTQPSSQPSFQRIPQPDLNVNYKEKYKDQIAQIKEMGIYDEEKIIDALKKCDGNVQYALNKLFG